MPSEAQTRLLRVLQEGEFNTVGGNNAIRSDVRIIAATHRDLTQSIRQGLFREDLYYRLNVVPIRMPALRERKEDIPELVKYFLSRSLEDGLSWKTLDDRAMDRLKKYSWPGNVRELENFIRRIGALYSQESISIEVIEAELIEPNPVDQNQNFISSGISEIIETLVDKCLNLQKDNSKTGDLYNQILKEIERPLISYVLNISRGNQLKCANILGLNRNTLRKKINELDIPVTRVPK
jgi:two-component system nitrogen regulation response regulator GlnG